ncbi:hypothetical protein [Uliginosibacterium sediminicola]|uniref:Uncharacterized protein n=1 Tax=Uliginosibacterium sediminicola TaxID=2024550 RepID=A0ABU9YVT7_9RHOO
MKTSQKQRAAWSAMIEAAAKGPWSLSANWPPYVLDKDGYEIIQFHEIAILNNWADKLGVVHWADHPNARRELIDTEIESTARLCHAAREAIPALLDDVESLTREVDRARAERDIERAQKDRALHLLSGIHALLYPPMQKSGDLLMRFRAENPDDVLQALSDRIRSLHDSTDGAADGKQFPERDPSKPSELQGIFHKFIVRRADGSDAPGGKHCGCQYFVLDLDHDPHAVAAMRAYGTACSNTHPQLSREISERFGGVHYDGQGTLRNADGSRSIFDDLDACEGCGLTPAQRERQANPEPCATCNGHGMIGGPSFYDPGEGGEPCPDCATQQTQGGRHV